MLPRGATLGVAFRAPIPVRPAALMSNEVPAPKSSLPPRR